MDVEKMVKKMKECLNASGVLNHELKDIKTLSDAYDVGHFRGYYRALEWVINGGLNHGKTEG